MAKREHEFESGQISKSCKSDFNLHNDDDDDDINLEEEPMQVDEQLQNQVLVNHKVEKKERETSEQLKTEPKQIDLKKNELGEENMVRQSTNKQEAKDAAVTSLPHPKEFQKGELERAAPGGREKNKGNSEMIQETLSNQKENRSAQKSFEPRGYQLELADAAMDGQNSVICAPTGSGKTATAVLVCKKMAERKAAEKDRPFKAVFVVCLRNLVAQQRDALGQYLEKVGSLDDKEFLDEALQCYDIVVLTSQILVNALERGDVRLENLSLIILDECHHTNLDHPYNQLMRFYHRQKINGSERLPQILGLTASLGVGSASDLGGAKDHYVQICANLDCKLISHVRDPKNKAELERYNPKPSTNQLKLVDKRPQDKEFYRVMTKLMEEIEEKYLTTGAKQVPRGTQSYESGLSTLKREAETTKEGAEEMVACEVLLKMNSAWMIHDELRTKDALQILNKYFRENLESKPGDVEKTLCRCYNDSRHLLEEIERQETLDDWPLLKELHGLLGQLFDEKEFSHGIVMASTIQTVDGILSFLRDYKPDELIFPKKIVGHRNSVENSMTEKEQEEVLQQFRSGKINLLVSTDVTQEGLDIPQCNFVIRYNFVSNEIGAVQAKGRARAPDSKCFLIANRDSVNVEREMKNIKKERLMQGTLDDFVSSSEELQELIRKCQAEQYSKLLAEDTPMDAATSRSGESDQFSLHCRRCKAFLCSAEHLIKYGCHYICTDEAFKERVVVEDHPLPVERREDTQTGKSLCRGCNEKIGSVMTYKRGNRRDGYSLGKESVMWKARDMERYGAIKKWENVPFVIHQETRMQN